MKHCPLSPLNRDRSVNKKNSSLNSRQRILTSLERQTPDIVPVFLRDLTLGLQVLNLTTPEVCAGGPNGGYDAEKSAAAVIASWRLFRHDCVVGSIHDLGLDVEALGGRTDFPTVGVPRVIDAPFAEKKRFLKAKVPLMDRDGRLPGVLRAYELVKKQIGDEVAIAANVEGPITKAAIFRETQNLMADFMRDPQFADDLVTFATDITISHIKYLARAGADFVFVAAATDGPVIISSDIYQRYTIPNLGRIVSAAEENGLKVIFHPHGRFTDERFRPLVDAAIQEGIAGFQFPENCDLGIAKRLWGDRISILGGVDVPTVLVPGPIERIREETRKCLEQAGPGGYVLMPSCSVHRGYPLDHIMAMVTAAREFGR